MKNINLIVVLLLATIYSTYAARYIRSVKGGRGFGGNAGGYQSSSPLSPSRTRFSGGGGGGGLSSSYGGSSGGFSSSGGSLGGSYGGSGGAPTSTGSYGGGGGGGFGGGQYAEEEVIDINYLID